jgi:hypothetical protein
MTRLSYEELKLIIIDRCLDNFLEQTNVENMTDEEYYVNDNTLYIKYKEIDSGKTIIFSCELFPGVWKKQEVC